LSIERFRFKKKAKLFGRASPNPKYLILTVTLNNFTKNSLFTADIYPANRSNLKTFQKALNGCRKAGPTKKPLLF